MKTFCQSTPIDVILIFLSETKELTKYRSGWAVIFRKALQVSYAGFRLFFYVYFRQPLGAKGEATSVRYKNNFVCTICVGT